MRVFERHCDKVQVHAVQQWSAAPQRRSDGTQAAIDKQGGRAMQGAVNILETRVMAELSTTSVREVGVTSDIPCCAHRTEEVHRILSGKTDCSAFYLGAPLNEIRAAGGGRLLVLVLIVPCSMQYELDGGGIG